MESLIMDLSVLFMIILVVSFAVKLLRQPIILGYIISGAVFSILFVGNGQIKGNLTLLSELGITFLLFLIGLEFSFKSFKEVGKDIVITTVMQSVVFFAVSFALGISFGFSPWESVYLSMIFLFSSTLLVAKWVEDKKDTHSLYGKIVLGTLVVQDLLAILFFTFLNFSSYAELDKMMVLPLGGLALLLTAYLCSRFLLNPLIKFTLKYPELMFVFSLGVCFFFVKISSLLGYTSTIGAFIGGLVLANTIYKNDIYGRLKPLIIFFSLLFFVGLGFQLEMQVLQKQALFLLVLSFLGLVLKPLVIYLTLRVRGYDLKNAVRCGLNLAQFSEFGIIIVFSATSSGQISPEMGSIAVISVVATMILSSYTIKYDAILAEKICKYLGWLEGIFPTRRNEPAQKALSNYGVVFIGYHELGKEIFSKFQDLAGVLVIENDPANLAVLKKENIPHLYNSVANPYFFEGLNFGSVNLLVSNLLDVEDNTMIIKKVKKENPPSRVIVTAKSLKDSLSLYDVGADYVLYSKDISENHLSLLMEDYSKDMSKLLELKLKDLERFKKKQEIKKKSEEEFQFYQWDTFLKRISKRKEQSSQIESLLGKK